MKFSAPVRNILFSITPCVVGLGLLAASGHAQNRLPKGTHFAAWEQPEFFVTELRDSFKSLR